MKSASLALLLLLATMLALAQVTPTSNLRIQGASAPPGLPVICRVYIDHSLDCEALSFGVTHDPSAVSVSNLQRGFYLEGSNLGGITPEFLMLEVNPLVGVGFIVGCLFDLTPPINDLMAGTNQEILIATYQVLSTAPAGDTPLQFTDALHDPPVMMLVVMEGMEYTPTWENGAITVLDDCNFNGVPDSTDIATGTSEDCDLDGVPDECG